MTIHPLEKALRSLRQILGIRELHGSDGWLGKFYSSLLECVTLGRGIPRSINGEPELRLVPSCRFLNTRYEPEVWGWLKKRTKLGSIILDVGAQFGLYAMLASRYVGATGRVYAFEPSPDTVAVLQRHLQLNALESTVEVVPAAVGATEGEVTFYVAGTHPCNTLAPTEVDPVPLTPIQIPAVTVDGFCAKRGIIPQVLKIDTEGWELHVLRGARKVMASPDLVVVVEMHPYAWASAGYTQEDFAAFLLQEGLQMVPLTGQTAPLTEYGEVWIKSAA